jgi:hypothetical protein
MAQPRALRSVNAPVPARRVSVAEHDGRVLGRRREVSPVFLAVGATGVARCVRGGSRGGGVVGGFHGLLGAVDVGLEADAEGEVAERHGAQHHHSRPHRVLPRPAAARAHRRPTGKEKNSCRVRRQWIARVSELIT